MPPRERRRPPWLADFTGEAETEDHATLSDDDDDDRLRDLFEGMIDHDSSSSDEEGGDWERVTSSSSLRIREPPDLMEMKQMMLLDLLVDKLKTLLSPAF
jgi:hypothetical protein